MTQDTPRPMKTLTELLPVTLPIELSVYFSCTAAWWEANRSSKQGDKCDGHHHVLLSHQAAKDAGQVVDEGGQYTDQQQ